MREDDISQNISGENIPLGDTSMDAWRRLLGEHAERGVPPEDTGLPGVDGALRGLLRDPDIRERSFRRGVSLCAAGDARFTALLYWRGNIFGIYRHTLAARSVEGILHDLGEFRLGWLPDEAVRGTGGDGTAFAALPPEAEGFPLVCFAGAKAKLFAGHGKIYENGHNAVAG